VLLCGERIAGWRYPCGVHRGPFPLGRAPGVPARGGLALAIS
jgi:hypothetical protein